MCATIKGDIIEYDDKLSRIPPCSIYDNKPVHILRNVTDKITCTTEKVKYGIRKRRPL